MKRHIFSPIDIKTFRTDFIECKLEYNTFFELVYIEKGKGFRICDDLILPFKKDDFFLHLPSEKNSIHLDEISVVHFIKFQKSFFNQKCDSDFSVSNWFTKVEFILNSNQQKELSIIKNNHELTIIKNIINLFIYENNLNVIDRDTNFKPLLIILLNVVSRNILPQNIVLRNKPQAVTIQDILNYIHLNICDTKKLSVQNLSEIFCISKKYFSEYFTLNAGISFKRYILEYKIKAVERRLLYSNLTLSEIAAEMGFTDLSHLNKTYKNISGIYPREVRKKN